MDDTGKEEGKNMEEGVQDKTVNKTQQLECLQEPNPVSVGGAISEMQKNVGNSGVEFPSGVEGPVDLDPNVPKTPEDAKIGTDPSNESSAETQSDKIESNVEVSLKIESEENGEKGEAIKDSVKLDASAEADNVVGNVDGVREVPLTVVSEENVEKREAVKDSMELDVSVETVNPVGNVDGVRLSEVSVKIGSEENGEKGESVKDSMDLDARHETDNPVGNVDGVHRESEASVKTLSEENVEKGESVKESKELDASVETDNLVGNVDGVHRESEVSVKIGSDENGEKGEALKDSMNLDTTVETDNPVGNVDGVRILSKENIEKEEVGKGSMELDVIAETDNPVGNVDGVHCESEVSVKIRSEENVQKGEAMKDFIELHASAETDNLVSYRDGGSHHTVVTVVPMEIEKEDNNGEEGMALKDGESSKPNASGELHISAEKDNVSQVEPDKRPDGEVEITKLMDGVSNKANPSNDLVRTDKSVRKLEPDIRDSEVAREKLVDGLSIKANPSKEPLNSYETYEAVRKLESYMPRYSKVAREKLVDGVINKAKPFTSEPPSNAKGNNLCKVERKLPCNNEVAMETETESDDDDEKGDTLTGSLSRKTKLSQHHDIKQEAPKPKLYVGQEVGIRSLEPERTFLLDPNAEGYESGTEEEQTEFLKEVENFYKERHLEFKPPKFYKEGLNLLKLWRAVIKLGGYEKVTSCKLWREVGQSFNPPKTCTTVSWTFRIFYEKALLEFEKERWHGNELSLPSEPSRAGIRVDGSQNYGSGRTLRDAAARAMQGWHSQRHFNGEDKHLSTMPKSDKQLKSSGLLKRKKLSTGDCSTQVTDMKAMKPRLDMMVFDIGPPADWVKINVKRFNDCFEVYALVPGLLREEVHVQSDPIGRLVISGQPVQMDNPWGVTPFKKVVSLPSRIDPHQTSAVVTLNGQLFVRVPFEQSDF